MAKKRIRNKDLAEALDITENSAYRLRRNDEMPRLTPERLNGICSVLQCQPGDLLEWVPDQADLLDWMAANSEDAATYSMEEPTHQRILENLTEYCNQVLALAWEGYRQFGAGAVIFAEKRDGPEIAYVERDRLTDPDCLQAIDETRPEQAAVVLYYQEGDLGSDRYSIFTLTGPPSPPECYNLYQRSRIRRRPLGDR